MGMFDKDKEIGLLLRNFVQVGEQFILWDARITDENVPTKMGPAVQSGLTVSKPATPMDKYDVTTLASAIAAKVRDAEPDDFPAVCQTAMVESSFGGQAYVIRFLKAWGNQSAPASATPAGEADDIPF